MIGYEAGMTDNNSKSAGQARAERLAAALRANLRKRKGLGDTGDPARNQHPAADEKGD